MLEGTNPRTVKDSEYTDMSFGDLGTILGRLQRQAQANRIPVLIMIDGWESSGKGYTIAKVVQDLEPRHYRVRVFDDPTEHEKDFPFLWRYWAEIPRRDQIVIYDRSSYFDLFNDPDIEPAIYERMLTDTLTFERQLVDDGYLVLKFFLHVSEEEQTKNIEDYKADGSGDFLLSPRDQAQNENYLQYKAHFDRVLNDSNPLHCPWYIIDMDDRKEGAKSLIGVIIEAMEEAVHRAENAPKSVPMRSFRPDYAPLDQVKQPEPMDEDDYDDRLDDLQDEARHVTYRLYAAGIPTVIAFEGVDAAGKGGTIRRLVKGMDPRSYEVHSIEAPTKEELDHHYLWRFYNRMPKRGHTAIFDRSWYGRVLVERVDELTDEEAWNRAYREINEMEQHMVNSDTLIMKYFLVIGKDEQADRFKSREEDPDKQHKITEDDWHNRSQWDDYMAAFNEMLVRTSTKDAPWVVVPSEDKKTARIQVLEDFLRRAKAKLGDEDA